MDYHHHSGNTVVAWLFRSERKSKVPKNRRLDSHSDRYRHHTRRIEAPWGSVNPSGFDDEAMPGAKVLEPAQG